MNNIICLYTILNPVNGIKDYSTNSEYAEKKSRQGYTVYANLIRHTPRIFRYNKGGVLSA